MLNKKYLPYLVLLFSVLLLLWVKRNQRGPAQAERTQPAEISSIQASITENSKNLVLSRHARCRMECRKIDESEVREILAEGVINKNRIEESDKGISVPLEGTTHDNQRVRIVVAPKKNELVLVTVIDLDTDWPCDCP